MNPVWALIISNVIWGAAAPIFKYALTDIPPFTFLFLRFFFAAVIFFPAVKYVEIRSINKISWVEIIVGSIMGFTIHIGFLFLGLQKTESINSSIILIGSPILLLILNVVFLHKKVPLKIISGVALSTIGVFLIIFAPFLFTKGSSFSAGAFEGNMLYFGSLVSNVLAVILFKRVSKLISPFTITFLSFAIAALSFFPFMIHELSTWNFTMLGQEGYIGIFYGIFFSSAVAYYLYFYGLRKLTTTDVEIFGYLNPIFTVLIAIPLLKEYPSPFFMAGALFICVGLIISEIKPHSHHLRSIKKED
ncbi:MAG: DMT family transporter [Patescibacteria group bacterium]